MSISPVVSSYLDFLDGKTGAASRGQAQAAGEGAVKLTLSAEAQEAMRAAAPRDLASLAKEARETLDALYARIRNAYATNAQVTKPETFINDTTDVFSDRALAAIALDKTGRFSRDEADYARATLTDAVHNSADAWAPAAMAGDNRAALKYAKTLAAAYDSADQDVRDALQWRPAHRQSIEQGIQYYEKEAAEQSNRQKEDVEGLIKQLQSIIDSQRNLLKPPKLGGEDDDEGESWLAWMRKVLKKIQEKAAAKEGSKRGKTLPGEKMISPEELFLLLQLLQLATAR